MAKIYWHKTPGLVKKLFPELLWNSSNHERNIHLTFDDGPLPEITEYILDILDEYNSKATFFCVGENVKKNPAIFDRILRSGHSVGNHTFNHINGWKTNLSNYLDNVKKCQDEFSSHGYNRIIKLFRPPYGLMTTSQLRELNRHYKIVMWDVLSGDFDNKLNPDKCLLKVTKSAVEGSIVVFHDSYKAERKIKYVLPRTLQYFSQREYSFSAL